ncbi:hypothetical protein PFISCL1PPCAC_28387 [Pristionchus fissidentatus]|uniref:Protein sleepless n=1 Tax=Pristionchus fissidentatus TaxID=1538716 RepID=A0AAV5X2D0_9BILA|nr:hypothetical protein PFISCL1PPCAC_1262 [Pristionchus fissidentatus]GMT37090.1 hypothetical protein PFISCL1PPCAC_28387 [Pristionchus fissidentatus]
MFLFLSLVPMQANQSILFTLLTSHGSQFRLHAFSRSLQSSCQLFSLHKIKHKMRAFIFILFLFLLPISYSIECYEHWSSVFDKEVNDDHQTIVCPKGNYCVKVKDDVEGYLGKTCDTYFRSNKERKEGCFAYSEGAPSIEHCYCTTDLCNSASASSILEGIFLSIIAHFLYRH